MHLSELTSWLQTELQRCGIEAAEAEVETRWILDELGLTRLQLLTRGHEDLNPERQSRLEAILSRRQRREPLQYILGRAWFRSLELEVSPAVLIPRPETEELVEKALEMLCELARSQNASTLRVADLGTGSGAIALALAQELTSVEVVASELSAPALALAQKNAQALGLSVNFVLGNGLEPLRPWAPFDLLLSNPPYVPQEQLAELLPELAYEPQLALSPGPDALAFYRLFAAEGPSCLKPGGGLLVELESRLAAETAALFGPPWQRLELLRDLQGQERFLRAWL